MNIFSLAILAQIVLSTCPPDPTSCSPACGPNRRCVIKKTVGTTCGSAKCVACPTPTCAQPCTNGQLCKISPKANIFSCPTASCACPVATCSSTTCPSGKKCMIIKGLDGACDRTTCDACPEVQCSANCVYPNGCMWVAGTATTCPTSKCGTNCPDPCAKSCPPKQSLCIPNGIGFDGCYTRTCTSIF
jgi:hypothetical protein